MKNHLEPILESLRKARADSARLDFLIQRGARVGWGRDGEKCAVYANEPDEFDTLIRFNGSRCFDDPRDAIDDAMQSNSQAVE